MNKENIRIYVDEKILLISEEEIILPGYRQKKDEPLPELITELRLPMKERGIVYTTASLKKSWKELQQVFKRVEAAGGLVKNSSGEYLFILRHQKWDLPKGKMEKNESPGECAIREVREECGLEHLELGRVLSDTFHLYDHKGKQVLKQTHWFEMFCPEWKELTPQTEEDITEVRWMARNEIKNTALKNTYASIRDLISETLFEPENGKGS